MTYDERGLYIDEAHLEGFAENYARGIRPIGTVSGKPAAAELRKTLRALDDLHDALALQWADIPSMPGAVRWLLDNRWLLRREGSSAARELAGGEQLRFAEGGTVLQKLCGGLLHSGQGELSDERILLFLNGFQKALILEREELALLSSGLKWAVISGLEELYRTVSDDHAPEDEARAAGLFTALRELSTRDLGGLIEQADCAEQALLADPAGIYPKMSRRSRAAYRRVLSDLARRQGMPEYAAAKRYCGLLRAQRETGGTWAGGCCGNLWENRRERAAVACISHTTYFLRCFCPYLPDLRFGAQRRFFCCWCRCLS